MGTPVGRGVVSHDPFDVFDAVRGEELGGPVQEPCAGRGGSSGWISA
jgi:hypothetical protein